MAISYIQSAYGGTSSWTTGMTVTAGNYLVVMHAGQSPIGGGTSSVADNLSTVYTLIGTNFYTGYPSRTSQVYMWGGFVPSSGALTITQTGTFGVTFSPGDAAGGTLYAVEFSGVDPTTPFLTPQLPINSTYYVACRFSSTTYPIVAVAAQVWFNVGIWWVANAAKAALSVPNGSAFAYTEHCDGIWFSGASGAPCLAVAVQLNPVVTTPTVFTSTTRENYINHFTCEVDDPGMDTTTGILPVTAVAAADRGFHITVDAENMYVNNGGTTTNWDVTRAVDGTTATVHNAGTLVYSNWAKGSLDQIRKDRVGYGPTLPACNISRTGDYFALTTGGFSPYTTPYVYTGHAWIPFSGGSLPTAWDDDFNDPTINLNKWTRYDPTNIGNNVIESMNNSWLTLDCFNSGISQRFYGYMQTVPTGTWKFRTKYVNDCATGQHYGPGMFVMNDAGKSVFGIGASQIHGQSGTFWFIRMTNGVFSSEIDLYDNPNCPAYIEVEYDGVSIIFRASVTGVYFTTFYTEALSTFIITQPKYIGFSLHPYGDGSTNPKMGMTGSWDWFRRVN